MTPKLKTKRLILRGIKANDIFSYYKIRSSKETMELLHGPVLYKDSAFKDFVQKMKIEREKGESFFWTIALKESNEFIGFVRLMSYKGEYFNKAFSSIGKHKFDNNFLEFFDRENGWELDYALLQDYRNKGIMKEAIGEILQFCENGELYPIYGRLNHLSNRASLKILKYYKFKEHMPLIDQNLLNEYGLDIIAQKEQTGMIFRWYPSNALK